MIVVSDTSPLGSLALIDHLWLLKNIYGTVIIPKVVANELNAAQDTRIQNILNLEWIQIQSLGDPTIAENLRQSKNLDLGEAYAIALAVQLKADELLIDERIGRREAQHYGLSVIGLLGVLVIAKQRNLIFKVQPVMNALINQAGFRVSVQLYDRILSLSREDQNP
jgi:predicted nucleic acid-binding protein